MFESLSESEVLYWSHKRINLCVIAAKGQFNIKIILVKNKQYNRKVRRARAEKEIEWCVYNMYKYVFGCLYLSVSTTE